MKRTYKKRIAFVLSLVMLLTGMNLFVFSTAAAGIVAGDINGDKKVNTKDLTRLMRYIAAEGEGVEAVEEALDTNGDQAVNTMDLTHLMKYIAGDNVVLYPIETEEPTDPTTVTYEVTFKDYDGTVLKTQTVNVGESATPPTDPSRTGFVFAGWSGSYENVTSDSVVMATYTEVSLNTYTVTFYDSNGSTVLAQRTGIEAGGFAEPPEDPVREGFVFIGWEGNYTNVNSNQTVVAKYISESADNIFKVSSASGSSGETVTITLELTGKVKVCGYDLALSYDSSKLSLESISEGNGVLCNNVGNQVLISYMNSSGVDETVGKTIVTLTFKINTSEKGAVPVSVSPDSVFDAFDDDVDYTLVNGSVIVK